MTVLDALDVCAARAEEDGQLRASTRDSDRAFAWVVADAMGCTLLRSANPAVLTAGKRLDRRARMVREKIRTIYGDYDRQRASAPLHVFVLPSTEEIAKLASINAAENAALAEQLQEVYTGFWEIEELDYDENPAASVFDVDKLRKMLDSAKESLRAAKKAFSQPPKKRGSEAPPPPKPPADTDMYHEGYEAGSADAKAEAEVFATLLEELRVKEDGEIDALHDKVALWKAKGLECDRYKQECERLQGVESKLQEVESELADAEAREGVLRSVVVEHLQCCTAK